MAVPSTSQTIDYANTALYLASDGVAKGSLFPNITDPKITMKIYMEKKAVEWMYGIDPSDSTLTVTGRYLYTILGKYGTKARGIVSGGGGSVDAGTTIITPPPYMFYVSASSFIVTGQSTKVITAYIGYNLIFVRGGVPQSTVNGGFSYYSWDSTTGTFTCFGAADADELFQLYAI